MSIQVESFVERFDQSASCWKPLLSPSGDVRAFDVWNGRGFDTYLRERSGFRGLPDDMSAELRRHFDDEYEGDVSGSCFTWLSLREVESIRFGSETFAFSHAVPDREQNRDGYIIYEAEERDWADYFQVIFDPLIDAMRGLAPAPARAVFDFS